MLKRSTFFNIFGYVGLLIFSLLIGLSTVQAQAPDRGPGPKEDSPVAGHSGGDDGESDRGYDGPPILMGASVSGLVYNEGLAPQAGVTVIIEGHGWQATT